MPIQESPVSVLVKLVIAAAVAALLVWTAFIFFEIIVIIFLAVFLAILINPVVNFLNKKGLPRQAAVVTAYGLALILVVFAFNSFIPKIAEQMNSLANSAKDQKLEEMFFQIETTMSQFLPFLTPGSLTAQLNDFFSNLFFDTINNFTAILSSLVSVMTVFIIVPFISFFLLRDKNNLLRGIINVLPNRYIEMSYMVINKITGNLERFVIGWLLDALFIGISAGVGLKFMGIENAFSIGLIAGAGHLIPYFGPVIGGIPAIIFSVIQFGDFSMLPQIAVLFLIIYTIDNGFVQPHVFSKATDIHPIIIILIILIGSKLFGISGMLLAVPVATVIKTASREIYYGFKNYKIIKTNFYT